MAISCTCLEIKIEVIHRSTNNQISAKYIKSAFNYSIDSNQNRNGRAKMTPSASIREECIGGDDRKYDSRGEAGIGRGYSS